MYFLYNSEKIGISSHLRDNWTVRALQMKVNVPDDE